MSLHLRSCSMLRAGLTCPNLVPAALQACFAHFLLPPLSTSRSLLNALLSWFCWYSWISPSAVQGQGVGWSYLVLSQAMRWKLGTHTVLAGLLASTAEARLGSLTCVSLPVTEQRFLVQELFLQSGPCSSSRDYKAHQILLQFSSS